MKSKEIANIYAQLAVDNGHQVKMPHYPKPRPELFTIFGNVVQYLSARDYINLSLMNKEFCRWMHDNDTFWRLMTLRDFNESSDTGLQWKCVYQKHHVLHSHSVGRPHKLFCDLETDSKRKKSKALDDFLIQLTGNNNEATELLQYYAESKFGRERMISHTQKTIQALRSLNLPRHSPVRHLLFSAFLKGVHTTTDDAEMLSVSSHYLHYCIDNEPVSNILSELKYPLHIRRIRITDCDKRRIKEFLKRNCPHKSGASDSYVVKRKHPERKPKYHQYCKDKELYKNYQVECRTAGIKPFSKTVLIRYRKYMKIRKERTAKNWSTFQCDYCTELKALTAKETRTQVELERIKILQAHKDRSLWQIQQLRKMKDDLKDTEAIIIEDFTKFITVGTTFVMDFVVVLYFKEKGNVVHRYYDFIAEREKHGFEATQAAFILLMEQPIMKRFKKIYFWSDGGSSDFRNHQFLYTISHFVKQHSIAVSYNFFESYHGHNECDGHSGAAHNQWKSALSKYQQRKLKLATMKELNEELNGMKNTQSTMMSWDGKIESHKYGPDNSDFKQFHEWVVQSPGHFLCRTRSNDPNEVPVPKCIYIKTKESHCTNCGATGHNRALCPNPKVEPHLEKLPQKRKTATKNTKQTPKKHKQETKQQPVH